MRPERWTLSYISFVLPLTAEEFFKPENENLIGVPPQRRIEWPWLQLIQRLVWTYGPEEALRRLNSYA